MAIPTEKQKLQYLKAGGFICLFCGSDDMVGGSLTSDDACVYQRIHCNNCGEVWVDKYSLTDVLEAG